MKEYIIVLSGWAVDKFVWKPLLNLLKQNYEVIYIDLNDLKSFADFRQKVVTTIEGNNIQTFSIIGWSLGSLVAIDIVTSTRFNIRKLILISGTSKFTQAEDISIGWHGKVVEAMIAKLKGKPEETILHFYKNIFNQEEIKDGYYDRFLNDVPPLFSKYSIQSLALGLEYLKAKDMRARIGEINIPVLLLHGDEDIICSLEASKYLKTYLKYSRLTIFTKTGHIPFYTKPKQCYKVIRDFMISNRGIKNDR